MFAFSLLYLFLIFSVLLAEHAGAKLGCDATHPWSETRADRSGPQPRAARGAVALVALFYVIAIVRMGG